MSMTSYSWIAECLILMALNHQKSSAKKTSPTVDEGYKPSDNSAKKKKGKSKSASSKKAPDMDHDDMINDYKTTDSNVMDWDRLELFTDGDPEEEKMLINLFVTNADETIELIKQQIDTGNSEEWENATHRLKGSAANLGAKNLADICSKAEESSTESKEAKQLLFRSIQASYNEIRDALHKRLS